MAIAGTLAVNILARTDKFNRGIKGARKELGGFRGAVSKATKFVSGFGGMLVGAAGVGSLAAFARGTLHSIDRLNKLSQQLGVSANTLQVWSHAADLGGTNLEAMTMGFKRFQRVIIDAEAGLSTAQRALGRLNLSSKDLLALDPARQLEAVSDAIKGIENPTVRAATAMELFGRSGAELLPTLLSDLKGIRKETNEWAADLSDNQVSELIDSMTRLKAALGAKGTQIIVDVTPVAIDALKGLEVLAEDIKSRQKKTPAGRVQPSRLKAFAEFGPIGALFPDLARGLSFAKADILRGIARGEAPPLAASGRRTQELERQRRAIISNSPRFSAESLREEKQQTRVQTQTHQEIRGLRQDMRNRPGPQVSLEPASF